MLANETTAPIVSRQGKYHVLSIGCIESNLSGSRYNNFFQKNNWKEVENPSDADLVICVTCGVTNIKINQSIEAIKHIQKSLKPGSYIVVAGCVPKIVGDHLQEQLGPKALITPTPQDVEQLIEREIPLDEVHANYVRYKYMRMRMKVVLAVRKIVFSLDKIGIPLPKYLPRVMDAYEDPRWYYISVGHGCLHQCAFCAIRLAKGKVKSRSIDFIIRELEEGIEAGHRKIVISGDDTGAYGQDTGSNFIELLKRMIEVSGDFEIYIRNLEPVWLIKYFDEFLEISKSKKIRAVTVPIQSGDNEVLRSMKRGHKIEPLIKCLKRLNREAPNLLILSHFMVGLPGEDSKAFRESLKVIKEVRFEGIAPDRFYAHPATPAYTMDNQVSSLVKWRRYIILTSDIIWSIYFNRGKFWDLRHNSVTH